MKIEIPFDNNFQTIHIPNNNILQVIYPNQVEKKNQDLVIRNAFENPIRSKSFNDLLKENNKILIIVNDAFRSTPTYKIISFIYNDIIKKNFSILIATGSHRKPTEEEKEKIVGIEFYKKFGNSILHHDSKSNDHNYLGKSKFGTEIFLDKRIFEYDLVITINSIEPHYFAGFTGGRKSIVPGIAGYQTIEQNHSLALKKEARLTKLNENPINEDLEDIIKKIYKKIKIFSINMVVDSEGDIYDCSTGDIFQSFYCLINSANKIYSSPVPQKADIVVTVARNPLNKNLYQSQKAIESAKLAVKKGGVIILVSSCNEGIGPANFYYLLKESSNPQYIFEKINKEYKLGYHKTAKLIEASFISDLFIVTNLNSKLFEGTFIKSYNSLEVAIKDALDKLGEKAKILLLMDGALISPLIKEYKYNQV